MAQAKRSFQGKISKTIIVKMKVRMENGLKTCQKDSKCREDNHQIFDNVAITNFARAAGGIEIWMGLSIFGNSVVNGYFDDASGITAYFNNYVPGYPSISSGFCATMLVADNFGANQGKWRNANCNHQNNPAIKSFTYVCEVPPTYSASSCEINYGGNCYWRSKTLVNGALMNFVDATTVCAQRGAKLASIHSKIEVDFIKQQYKGTNVKAIMLGAQAVSNTTSFSKVSPLSICKMQRAGNEEKLGF
ncbi:Protein CBG01325 [Caenorhabditis briggsae]|uniref:Protein CBG01325 n=1 Tax=Caenorhabditis briggsae TaxID=6238 RepID=A8WQ53_CAEBR|nr:Protein CBG01325 [Caenorhabditis briggsae]CAP22611.1 Protein CBG01325 [Caenorhabditis briggsae]